MEECELKKFTSTDCGTSSHYPEEETVIKLHQCVRNTDSHLTSLKLNLNDVTSKGQLLPDVLDYSLIGTASLFVQNTDMTMDFIGDP